MLSQESKQLVDDHSALEAVLGDLKAALNSGDVKAVYSELDLFWARLAVHIRAEHLHLFPAVLGALSDTSGQSVKPNRREGELVLGQLRADHDFFMHELARAIAILRDLLGTANKEKISEGLNMVREAVFEIEKQLVSHNELEENKVYRWTAVVLSEQEQSELAELIDHELANRPQRFSAVRWSNEKTRLLV